jgi:DNA polymerase-3 subunit alpha
VDWSVVNKRALESLAKSGALDSLNVERGRVVAGLDRIVSFGLQLHRAAAVGQTSLFGDVEMSSVLLQLPIVDPATVDQKLSWERELLGMYVSPHPLSEAERRFPDLHVETVSVVSSDPENRRLSVGGMIQGFRSFSTKDGRPMGSFRLDDLQSSLEVVVFSRTFEQVRSKLSDGEIVVVDGKLDGSDGRLRVLADGIWAIDEAAARPAPNGGNGKKNGGNGNGRTARPGNGESVPAGPPPVDTGRRITVEIGRSDDRTADIERIVAVYQALQRYRGGDTVEIVVRNGSRRKSIPLPSDRVGYCPELAEELSAILPPESVSVHDPTPADPSIA